MKKLKKPIHDSRLVKKAKPKPKITTIADVLSSALSKEDIELENKQLKKFSSSKKKLAKLSAAEARKATKEQKASDAKLLTASGVLEFLDSAINDPDSLERGRFEEFDDSSLPLAENFFQFMTDARFMVGYEPFAKQIEIVINLLTDYCPVCSDKQYAQNIPTKAKPRQILKKITFLKHGVCPKCGITRTQIWKKKLLKRYRSLALLAGQRSSKSILSSMIAGYMLHILLKMENPAKTYKLLPNAILQMSFTATTFQQAYANVYTYFYSLVKDSPWFKAYHKLLDEYKHKTGEDLYKFKETVFFYRHKKLAGNVQAPDQRTLRGYTRILAMIDEIGWFNNNKPNALKMNAQQVFVAMNRSLSTVAAAARRLHLKGRYDVPQALMLNVSSPSHIKDKICELGEESKRPGSTIFHRHYSCFEMNPNLTEKDLEEEKSSNFADYKRDFLAIPPMASNAFITSKKVVKAACDPELPNIIDFTQTVVETRTGQRMTSGVVEFDETHPYFNSPKVLAIDAGYSSNSFAGAVVAIDLDEEDPTGSSPYFVHCGFFELVPYKSQGLPVDFSDVFENIIMPIVNVLNVKEVYADRWQSIKLLQDVMREADDDVTTRMYSPDYKDFLAYKELMFKGKIIAPGMEMSLKKTFQTSSRGYPECMAKFPISHFAMQCLSVNDIMGKKVDKGDNCTDDLFRASVLAVSAINGESDVIELLSQTTASQNKMQRPNRGVAVLGSMGGNLRTFNEGAFMGRAAEQPRVFVGGFQKPLGF